MTKYAFFVEKVDRWEKDMASLWGNFNICPPTPLAGTPCHSQAELFSISSLKVWGDTQKPHCDIAYLLVWVENTKKDRCYSISLVWVHPNQVRVATMEEVVEKLTACTPSGANWPYALVQLCKDPNHAPLPKNKHLGILPQGKAQETLYGWISQLKVCQLLATGPHVIYPMGLNGHDEPEPLDNGISLITCEHIYLVIDIPSPLVEEPDQKMLPLEDIPTILITSIPKSKGSMTMEVSNLLSQAVLEASSCESQHSSPRRPTTTVVFISPPWKPEDLSWSANTSSQASIDEGEASLDDIPANISPIAAISRSGSIIPWWT